MAAWRVHDGVLKHSALNAEHVATWRSTWQCAQQQRRAQKLGREATTARAHGTAQSTDRQRRLKEAWDRSHTRGPVEEGVHAVYARPIPARVTRFVAIEADQSAFQMYSSSVLAGTCDQSPQRKDLRAPFMALCHWKEFWLLYGRSTCREAPCPSL